MASDRSWIGRNRYNEAKYLTDEYKIGVDNFIQFAIDHLREEDNGLMRCPCRNCGNGTYKKPSTVKLDLYRHGIMQWRFLGSSSGGNKVTWAGPKGRANKHKKSKVITSGEGGEAHEGSEKESHVEGCYEVGESSCLIKFERKRRSNSEGDYGKKPAWDARPTVYFLKNDKGLFQATPKKTLGHIVRLKWDEHTLNTKGAKREAFYDSCIKIFKEYYAYPKIYDPEDGDRVVRAHLKRYFKSYLNAERGRLMQDVNEILKRGYPESVINIRLMRPYYFSQRAWNAICDHWETPEFANKSEKGHNSRMKVEFTPRTGAKPFDQRREEIDAQREAKGEMPITDEEFLSVAYNPTDPAVKDLQEKMKNVRSSMPELTLETPSDEPPSPSTLKEIQRKKDIFVMMQARPPTRGKLNLYPQQTVGELVGAMEATQWAKQMAEKSRDPADDVSGDIYVMMSTVFDEVSQLLHSLPAHEVKQSVLDEEIHKLAIAASPDPSLQTRYMRTADALIRQIVKNTDKIILEIVNCYNGIICLFDLSRGTDALYLWTVIRMFKQLPSVPPTPVFGWPSKFPGFGYDSISDDYKPSIRKKQKERYVRSNTVETQSEKAVEVHKSVEVDDTVNQEDEDMDAHNYPLF
ncbi:hypothetical protein POM88_031434 [Heracleum sosnowskyi]|uniref:Transposase-associated domain-containing protein n=1 Tax=Heracleum sosnowskyi TaxID=360622 RepID=A0AAD8MJ47_9APIA|nr:hypothetical protein POM88_031434 [Heracleum sosnowskyi]